MSMKKYLRLDGWTNIFTSKGVDGKDKQTGYRIAGNTLLTEETCRSIYRSDGWGRKIVDRIVSDMTRAWVTVSNDTDGTVLKALNKIKAKKNFYDALIWAKVFGGSIIVMFIDDGSPDLETPLNEKTIKRVHSLKVYDRYRAIASTYIYDETSIEKCGETEFYEVYPVNGNSFRVHESRVLRFDGILTDDKTFIENQNWHESLYGPIISQLTDLAGSYHATKDIIDDFIQTILKVNGLQDLIASDQDDLVKKRLEIIDLGRHVCNTIMLDKEEDYKKEASSVSGLDALLQKFQEALAAVVDMPLAVLVGKSAGSLNATGDNEIRGWYDKIASDQQDQIHDQLHRLISLIISSSEIPISIDDWAIKFNSLWQPTEKETVESRRVQAETDKIYIEAGVLVQEEVTLSRFGGSEYSFDTVLSEGSRENMEIFGEKEEKEKSEEK